MLRILNGRVAGGKESDTVVPSDTREDGSADRAMELDAHVKFGPFGEMVRDSDTARGGAAAPVGSGSEGNRSDVGGRESGGLERLA